MLRKYMSIIAILVLCLAGQAEAKTLTYGAGRTELFLFTDFYCPPCQILEELISAPLDKIVRENAATVTFVSFPGSQKALVVTLHMIGISAGKPYRAIAESRKQLYSLARSNQITGPMLEQWIRDYKGSRSEVEPYVKSFQQMIEEHKINSTPSLVVRQPDGRKKIYTGYKEIQQAIGEISGKILARSASPAR